jgi:hypothetical protein
VIELGNRRTNDFTQSRFHNGQSVKTGSSLAPMRRRLGKLSGDDLTPPCLGRADRDLGFCRSVLGGGGSRVVRVRHHLLDLGLQPLTQRFAFWPTIGGTRPATADVDLLRETDANVPHVSDKRPEMTRREGEITRSELKRGFMAVAKATP